LAIGESGEALQFAAISEMIFLSMDSIAAGFDLPKFLPALQMTPFIS